MSVVLFNYGSFTDNLALSAAGQEVSIAIRQAEVYGLSVKEVTPGSGNFNLAYGVHFSPATPNDYILFVDKNANNVYDPRMYGYGTSYRNYVDKTTGQPRFPYDDINAIRQPNYIVRSKIDTHNFSDTYGPMQNSGIALNDIRQHAQDAFLDDSLSFRNDMMSRLMRKRNAELWQTRQAPLSKAGSRMMGGGQRGSASTK